MGDAAKRMQVVKASVQEAKDRMRDMTQQEIMAYSALMLTPAGRALAEGQTRAVKAEAEIQSYLGHGPEFTSVRETENTSWGS